MSVKQFNVIVKANANRFIKFSKVENRIGFRRLFKYLDNIYPDWRYGNVYHQRKQVGNFTKRKRIDTF